MNVTRLFHAVRPFAVAFIAVAMIASPIAAQDKQAQTGKTSAKDSNIKSESDRNSATAPDAAITSRKAARAHGGSADGTTSGFHPMVRVRS